MNGCGGPPFPDVCSLLSAAAFAATPFGGIGQREQVQAGEQQQGERQQRQEAYPDGGLFLLSQGDDVDDDGHRESNGQPAVDLPNPLVPIQWDLLQPIRAKTCSSFAKNCGHPYLAPW